MKTQNKFPRGWDENRIKKVLDYYETQSEQDAVAEDEAAYGQSNRIMVEVPKALLPVVRAIIARHKDSTKASTTPGRRSRKR